MHSIAQNDHKILMITNNTQKRSSSSKQNHHRFDSKLSLKIHSIFNITKYLLCVYQILNCLVVQTHGIHVHT